MRSDLSGNVKALPLSHNLSDEGWLLCYLGFAIVVLSACYTKKRSDPFVAWRSILGLSLQMCYEIATRQHNVFSLSVRRWLNQ